MMLTYSLYTLCVFQILSNTCNSCLSQINLAKWEDNRENERRRLLLEEAKTKQQGGASASVSKRRNFLKKWMSRLGKKFDFLYSFIFINQTLFRTLHH